VGSGSRSAKARHTQAATTPTPYAIAPVMAYTSAWITPVRGSSDGGVTGTRRPAPREPGQRVPPSPSGDRPDADRPICVSPRAVRRRGSTDNAHRHPPTGAGRSSAAPTAAAQGRRRPCCRTDVLRTSPSPSGHDCERPRIPAPRPGSRWRVSGRFELMTKQQVMAT
jgi:hypothetical protein